MRYLLDTNVVSELRKVWLGKADGNVTRWFSLVRPDHLCLSVITVQELEVGILLAKRKDPLKASMFRSWLDQKVLPTFAGRILPVNLAIAQRGAALHVPNPCPPLDALIAATALVHGLTVFTRNPPRLLPHRCPHPQPLGPNAPTSALNQAPTAVSRRCGSCRNARANTPPTSSLNPRSRPNTATNSRSQLSSNGRDKSV